MVFFGLNLDVLCHFLKIIKAFWPNKVNFVVIVFFFKKKKTLTLILIIL
jgi:hypothetical protein